MSDGGEESRGEVGKGTMKAALFEAVLAEPDIVDVGFSPRWMDDDGYFGPLVSVPFPKARGGDRLKCTDPNGRRALIIVTAAGNAVFFERFPYTGQTDQVVVVHCESEALYPLILPGALTEQQFRVLTRHKRNIGHSVQHLVELGATLYGLKQASASLA